MTKKVLVIHYSQSGQLTNIIRSIVRPLKESNEIDITCENLQPAQPYPFPWPFLKFFDVFPESVLMEVPEMKPFSFNPGDRFDLIILGYTVWYLSPSLPASAFLKSLKVEVMRNVPVITIVNCKDRWLMAQEKVKEYINKAGGRLIGNVVFVHQGNEISSLVSTLRWLFTGKKQAFWKIFPTAGVAEEKISDAARFGKEIYKALQAEEINPNKPLFGEMKKFKVNPKIILQEKVGYRNFVIWAKIVKIFGTQGQLRRLPVLVFFIVYLGCLVTLSVPLTFIISACINPFRKNAIQKEKEYFERLTSC